MVPYFADALQCFVVQTCAKLCPPWVASESLDSPDKAASFQVRLDPVPLRIEISAADISNGPYRAIQLFLFNRGTRTVDAGVTLHAKGAGAFTYSAPVRQDKNWRSSEVVESGRSGD